VARCVVLRFKVESVDTVNEGSRDAYLGTRTVEVASVGADAMGASRVTTVMAVVRAVVRTAVTGPTVAATSPNDSRGNVVGGASCNAHAGVVVLPGNGEGVESGIRSGWVILRWLGKRVRATAHGGCGRDVVCHGWG